jgi:hypothetical protein
MAEGEVVPTEVFGCLWMGEKRGNSGDVSEIRVIGGHMCLNW